jgi:adenosylcobinamide amidohydrolase
LLKIQSPITPSTRHPTEKDVILPVLPSWRWQVTQRTLIIRLREPYRSLSWASLGGGTRLADTIINSQVLLDDRAAVERPKLHLLQVAKSLELDPSRVVGMMTAAQVKRAGYSVVGRDDLIAGAWCTVGCSNALRIGDPATAVTTPGTINLALVINQCLSAAAMVEAMAMATEARVAAVMEANIRSTRTNRLATGTGTDCIVIAARHGGCTYQYCGKHTVIGEMIGKAVLRATTQALRRAKK